MSDRAHLCRVFLPVLRSPLFEDGSFEIVPNPDDLTVFVRNVAYSKGEYMTVDVFIRYATERIVASPNTMRRVVTYMNTQLRHMGQRVDWGEPEQLYFIEDMSGETILDRWYPEKLIVTAITKYSMPAEAFLEDREEL